MFRWTRRKRYSAGQEFLRRMHLAAHAGAARRNIMSGRCAASRRFAQRGANHR
jgi:hypothetical protein